jgi:mannose-1-phosphate guanylyltransferase/mannose-6-phosphate isomerase
VKVLILAGGSGTRLWPSSTEAMPKQFLHLGAEGGFSFLQRTIRRFLPLVAKEDLWVVGHEKYAHIMREQMKAIHPLLEAQIILEPSRKNTAPALVLALKFLEERETSQEEIIVVASSDHLISNEGLFLEKILVADRLARADKLVMLGVFPHKPETGYGYIKVNQSTLDVEAFVEKPSQDKAEEFLKEGTYLWNCGIFVCRIATFWEELHKYHPMGALRTSSYHEVLQIFSELPSISIDYALMEKTKNAAALDLDLFWSDIGSWDSIFDAYGKDDNFNVKIGNVLDIDTKNSLIIGGKKLISTVGLDNMVIIETDDILFIGKRGETQKVKMVVEQLNKR